MRSFLFYLCAVVAVDGVCSLVMGVVVAWRICDPVL